MSLVQISGKDSQRYIPVLLGRVFVALGLQHFQSVNELLAGFARLDDGVHVAVLGGDVRVGKARAEFLNLFIAGLGQNLSFLFV